ncbi:hypothetical protein [Propionispora hippei]|uniref:Uncharacterized protein n=1 Tax=Propionispora hippei DSM 15287 TaxID=1123003 RepID=A0A1M6KY25_9FIRM|nr:hypothetical protein [Propionispora hippei]SHJ63820.1 hypothetical protein SAMN02745170_02980 [Propionispora hippei DSM 15287]
MSNVIATFYNFGETGANKGRVRLISSSGSTPAVVSGSGVDITNTDPIAFYFNGGSSTGTRVLLVQRRYNASYVQIFCYLSVYDPSTWTQTVAPNTAAYQYSDSTDLLNIYNLNSPGGTASGTLYGADYSAGRVFKLVHGKTGGTETLTLDTPYYQFAATGSGATAYSVDTVFNTESSVDYVYAVAQQYAVSGSGSDPANYTYYNSIIVKLDAGTLAPVTGGGPSATLAPNVFDLQYYGGNLYATALGGAQWYGTGTSYPNTVKWNYASRIQKVTTGLTVTDLVRPANASETGSTYNNDKFDIRALGLVSDGTAYILTGSYYTESAYNYLLNGRLWKVSASTLFAASNALISSLSGATAIESLADLPGFMWALLPANDLSKVWGMLGDNLTIYDATGLVGDPIDAANASEWVDGSGDPIGSPAFNAISLATPSISKLKAGAAPASIKSVRGFVHPLLASRAGIKPEDFDKFISAHFAKQ